MITQTQLDELKTASKQSTVETLIAKWEAELFQIEMGKSGSRKITLRNLKSDVTKEVVGKEVAPNFVFHKDVWGGKFYILTHAGTGIKVLSGKKLQLTKIIKEFVKWKSLNDLDVAITVKGMKALEMLNVEEVNEYRDFYTKAGE